MKPALSYKNEDDKCYGATGMVVGMVVLDGEDMLSAISLDAAPSEMVEFVEDFYFTGNPSLSAKVAWSQMVHNYNLALAMLISNVMCRTIVLHKSPVDPAVKEHLRHHAVDEGHDSCSLEEDEINRIFNKNYSYLLRVFNHQGVQEIINDFARELKHNRRFTRFEVMEHLRALSML